MRSWAFRNRVQTNWSLPVKQTHRLVKPWPPADQYVVRSTVREDRLRDGRAAVLRSAVWGVPERVVAVRGNQLVVAALRRQLFSSAWLVGCAKELERLYCSPSRSFRVTALWRLDQGSVSAAMLLVAAGAAASGVSQRWFR